MIELGIDGVVQNEMIELSIDGVVQNEKKRVLDVCSRTIVIQKATLDFVFLSLFLEKNCY